jgi:hypothetical protein
MLFRTLNGQNYQKTISDYGPSGPDVLQAIESQIETTADNINWSQQKSSSTVIIIVAIIALTIVVLFTVLAGVSYYRRKRGKRTDHFGDYDYSFQKIPEFQLNYE